MPMELPFSPEGATGFGLVLPLLWWIWREIRKARSEDKRDDAESKLRADLMAISNDLNVRLKEANDRADRYANDRNQEREKRIRAEAERETLKEHIEDAASRCQNGRSCGLRSEGR